MCWTPCEVGQLELLLRPTVPLCNLTLTNRTELATAYETRLESALTLDFALCWPVNTGSWLRALLAAGSNSAFVRDRPHNETRTRVDLVSTTTTVVLLYDSYAYRRYVWLGPSCSDKCAPYRRTKTNEKVLYSV